MKRNFPFFALMGMAGFSLAMVPGHAMGQSTTEKDRARAMSQLSPEKLDVLDRRGYFTPAFKAAVHDLANTQQALDQAKKEEKKLQGALPALQTQSTAAEAKVASLRQELTKYDHPDELDFVTLQNRMKDAKAKPEEQLVLAQAYVWAYPASPHLAEAQQDLQQVQQKLADRQQAEKDAAAARAAARASLVQRAQAKDLKMSEWNDFLRDMSQEEVVKYIGRPQTYGRDYWLYTGAWSTDPYTGQKVGIQVSFNGTRVNGVSVGPVAP